MQTGHAAKVLLIDIETHPIISANWTIYESNAVWVIQDTFILCFAAQWLGDREVKTYALPDYPGYKHNKANDKPLIKDLWKLLDRADIVIAHNGDAFDVKKIKSRMAVHDMDPPSPFRTIDTLKIARQQFKFDSNKLDNIGRYLKEGRKIPNTGAALWRACGEGDRKAWKKMRKYNAQDVRLLCRVYNRLKPWAPNHPNLTLYSERPGCPVCQSTHIWRKGYDTLKMRRVPRFQCQDCGHWFNTNRGAASAQGKKKS